MLSHQAYRELQKLCYCTKGEIRVVTLLNHYLKHDNEMNSQTFVFRQASIE